MPPDFPPALAYFWKRGEKLPWLRDMIRLELKILSGLDGRLSANSWSKEFLKKIKARFKEQT